MVGSEKAAPYDPRRVDRAGASTLQQAADVDKALVRLRFLSGAVSTS